jgi:hypothetical protein
MIIQKDIPTKVLAGFNTFMHSKKQKLAAPIKTKAHQLVLGGAYLHFQNHNFF